MAEAAKCPVLAFYAQLAPSDKLIHFPLSRLSVNLDLLWKRKSRYTHTNTLQNGKELEIQRNQEEQPGSEEESLRASRDCSHRATECKAARTGQGAEGVGDGGQAGG